MSAVGYTIFVRALRLEAGIGLYPHERGRTQPVSIDLALAVAAEAPARHLPDTVNYDTVVQRARDIVAAGHIELVETLADRIAAACLEDPRVRSVRVRIEKPLAIHGAEAAGVEIERSR